MAIVVKSDPENLKYQPPEAVPFVKAKAPPCCTKEEWEALKAEVARLGELHPARE